MLMKCDATVYTPATSTVPATERKSGANFFFAFGGDCFNLFLDFFDC